MLRVYILIQLDGSHAMTDSELQISCNVSIKTNKRNEILDQVINTVSLRYFCVLFFESSSRRSSFLTENWLFLPVNSSL